MRTKDFQSDGTDQANQCFRCGRIQRPLLALILLLSAAAAVFLLVASQAGRNAPWASGQVSFTADRQDFQLINPGQILKGVLTVTNNQSTPISISAISTSCDCTAVTLASGQQIEFPHPVAPGQSLPLNVQIDTEHAEGKQQVRVAVQYTDPDPHDRVTTFAYTAPHKPRVYPTFLSVPESGRAEPLRFWVGGLAADPIEIQDIECSNPRVQTETIAVQPDGEIELDGIPYAGWIPAYEIRLQLDAADREPFVVKLHLKEIETPLSVNVTFAGEEGLTLKPKSCTLCEGSRGMRIVELQGLSAEMIVGIENQSSATITLLQRGATMAFYQVSAAEHSEGRKPQEQILFTAKTDMDQSQQSVTLPIHWDCGQ
ncbi:DUF1573 domain-containing protein [Stieleria sp. TO1_6]|uniref:DUF1573 domain-containing protein n=1 Tax=Stieleria tagensis TaxID=2956795 RepID=UPI00209B5620|nr:DUF1573 domain-containing protein [Stieleria tagensis]MCO8123787.1 DUF1573 domain-containing protein [Stieleria tagensis]